MGRLNKDAQAVEELKEENVEAVESACCQEECEEKEMTETIDETWNLKARS